jgi:hypothetical protein
MAEEKGQADATSGAGSTSPLPPTAEEAQHIAQLRHVLAAPLGTAGVAEELSGMDRRPH